MASTMERRRDDLLEGAAMHGQGLGSGSGAGMWLSGTKKGVAASEGRKYHISAEASHSATSTPSDLLLAMKPSGSGDVDLDLSFDFVSQLESSRPSQTPQKERANAGTMETDSPRGMSAARWDSRARKQPPAALTLSNKKQSLDVTSQFSPISPLDGRSASDAPLVITPLSSTKRAVDAGIQPGTSAVQTKASTLEMIRKQRLAAQQKQKDQSQQQSESPAKTKRSVPFGYGYVDDQQAAPTVPPRRKTVLGENKVKGNAQIVPHVEQGDVFDEPGYDYKRHLKQSASVASTQTGGGASSFATAHESHGGKGKRGRRQQTSIESTNSFDTALTKASNDKGTELPSIELQPPPLPNTNALGLDFAGSETVTGLGLMMPESKMDSPHGGTQHSSPFTPFSPLFSEFGTVKDSEYTQSTTSEGSRTPGTAFSTLFEDRAGMSLDAKVAGSAQMTRGHTAPLSAKPLVKDVIEEEDHRGVLQAKTAPSTSFLVDLPSMDGNESDGLRPKSRQNTGTSVSDQGSSPRRGEETMIVSTTSSPTDELEFLFRKPSQIKAAAMAEEKRQASGARVGPWPQSPLLLGSFLEGDVSDELVNTLGLGIDMGGKVTGPDHTQLDMSELSVERAVLASDGGEGDALGLDLGLGLSQSQWETQGSKGELEAGGKGEVSALPSFLSSVEGFAINVTPAVRQPEHTIDVPSNVVETDREETTVGRGEGLGRGRWSSKLWSVASKSPFRSPSRSGIDEHANPPMRALTLVSKQGSTSSGRGRRERDNGHATRLTEDEGYHSMPSSAVMPQSATFAPLQAPPQALYNQPRSSKHVKRSSRLRYLPHLQLEMDDNGELEDVKSPRVAPSPSGFTPKMEYMMGVKNKRHSWGYASTAAFSGTPSWLAPSKQELTTGQHDFELFANARNSTLSAVGGGEPEMGAHGMLETVVEDGLRRRGKHRATNSVPSTPTVVPATWTVQQGDEEEENDARVQFASSPTDHTAQPRPRRTMLTTMSIFGPASAAITPYLVGLSGSRNRNKMVKPTGMKPNTRSRSSIQPVLFTDHRGGPDGFFAFSGKALENASPSRSLFFAGFLLMPWLWFIGGWGLEDNGRMYVERDPYWQEGDEEAILLQLLQKEPVGPLAVRASSRRLHHPSDSLHRPSARTTLVDGSDGEEEELRYSMGKPESLIDAEEEHLGMQSRKKARSVIEQGVRWEESQEEGHGMRRTRSLLDRNEQQTFRRVSLMELQGRNDNNPAVVVAMDAEDGDQEGERRRLESIDLREDHQTGIAYSTDNSVLAFPQLRMAGGAFATPLSQWEEYDDGKDGKGKRHAGKTFLQQIWQANSTALDKLASSLSSSSSQRSLRQGSKKRGQGSTKTSPFVVAAFTQWTKLDRFVLWNRIMALVASLVVFGAFIVAICVIISDW